MFFFISGLLFNYQVKSNKYKSVFEIAKKKGIRLLVPYVISSSIIMLACGNFGIANIIKGDFWHLWFLPVLFWCFVIFFPCVLKFQFSSFKVQILALSVSFALTLLPMPKDFNILGIFGFFQWGIFFIVGTIIGNYEDKFHQLMKSYSIWIVPILLWVLVSVYYRTPYMNFKWYNTVSVIFAVFSIFFISNTFCSNLSHDKSISKLIILLADASMGIYIIHFWLLTYTTSTTVLTIIGLFDNNSTFYTIVSIVQISFITFTISYLITRILKMNRHSKYIIG